MFGFYTMNKTERLMLAARQSTGFRSIPHPTPNPTPTPAHQDFKTVNMFKNPLKIRAF
jgi:hypothetical protein